MCVGRSAAIALFVHAAINTLGNLADHFKLVMVLLNWSGGVLRWQYQTGASLVLSG